MKDFQHTDEKRNKRIYKLYVKGYLMADIARKEDLTGERVRQIIVKMRAVDNSCKKNT